jgi:hypothetical protein
MYSAISVSRRNEFAFIVITFTNQASGKEN